MSDPLSTELNASTVTVTITFSLDNAREIAARSEIEDPITFITDRFSTGTAVIDQLRRVLGYTSERS